jgi:hypothetical protein
MYTPTSGLFERGGQLMMYSQPNPHVHFSLCTSKSIELDFATHDKLKASRSRKRYDYVHNTEVAVDLLFLSLADVETETGDGNKILRCSLSIPATTLSVGSSTANAI